jgi:TolB-like protein
LASVWAELKRRNVMRVGIAYAAISWLLAQVADLTFGAFDVPAWLLRAFLVVLLLGFPVALLLAWVYEVTPEGVRKESDVDASRSSPRVSRRHLDIVIIAVLAVALVLFAVERFVLLPERIRPAEITRGFSDSVFQGSIAVLPFLNMSSDPEQEYFSDGLSEEILTVLARIPELKVIGRTSSFAFKGKNEDLRVIGQSLGVQTVLEGSVRKSGNRVSITARLVDVSDGAHVWSDTYERDMTDIFDIQDEVAAAVADALQLRIGAPPSRGHPTDNAEAYALFLKGRVLLNVQKGREATELLKRATDLDPGFAEAYELLAASYWMQGGAVMDTAEALSLSAEAAARASAIDPGLAFAEALHHMAKGGASSHLDGIKALQRAWYRSPGDSAPLRPLIYELLYAGYHREAHGVARQYVSVDPLSPIASYSLGETLYAIGQSEEALVHLQIAYDLGNEFARWFLPAVHISEGRDEDAIALFEADLERINVLDRAWVSELVSRGRDPADGQAYLDRRIPAIVDSLPAEHAYWWQTNLTLLYLLFGHLDRYYDIIFEVGPNVDTWTDADVLAWQGVLFRQSGFTSHPRYLQLAEDTGIVAVWEQLGAPDFCSKANGQWVCE